MNRKLVGGLLISFLILLILVIISLFVDFGKFDATIYTVFIGILFYLTWVATRKISVSSPFKKLIGSSILFLIPLLILTIISLFTDIGLIEKVIYFLFGIDFLFLFILFIRRSIRNIKSKKLGKEVEKEKLLERIVRYVVVYGIPLAILGYVLYMNFLPFGFEKTYVLDVGVIGDTTTSNEIYLEKTDALGNIITDENGITYRELNGVTSIILQPKAILKNPLIEVNVEGEGISVISPEIDFNPNDHEWDLDIDFSGGIPNFLEGNVELKGGCAYFDGQTQLVYPDTADQFEQGPFMIYIEWIPEKQENWQQIIGHWNWEIWQNKNKVQFKVGKMDNAEGPVYYVSYNLKEDFYNNKHKLIAIYTPLQQKTERGYIQLYVDGKFAERIEFGNETIWKEEGGNRDLSLGKLSHVSATYYQGTICNAKFSYKTLNLKESNEIEFALNQIIEDSIKIPLFGQGKIEKIELKIKKT